MGWITDRHMRRGGSLYTGGPKRKGPLKRIVARLGGDYDSNLFGSDYVLLECGHLSKSYGGQKAICAKCKNGEPVDSMHDYGYSDALHVPIADGYVKNFTEQEVKARRSNPQYAKG